MLFRAFPRSAPGGAQVFDVTGVDRLGFSEDADVVIPGSGLTIETAALPAASSGVYYEEAVAVSGQIGTVVMIDVSPSVAPGPNRYSPRDLFLHPYLGKFMGTPVP